MLTCVLLLSDVLCILQRFLADPANTLKAYWPKFKAFLKYKFEQRLAHDFPSHQPGQDKGLESKEKDMEAAQSHTHSRDLLVDARDYLAFLNAVQQRKAGLGLCSSGQHPSFHCCFSVKSCWAYLMADQMACAVIQETYADFTIGMPAYLMRRPMVFGSKCNW